MGRMYADPALLFVVGAFTVLVGLAVVLAHNRWSGGPLAIIVTLYGWLMLIRGLIYVSLSPSARLAFYEGLDFERLFLLCVRGNFARRQRYLTYGGLKRGSG
jgi:vacuolar-type H+-ATPase subunit I/STV1